MAITVRVPPHPLILHSTRCRRQVLRQPQTPASPLSSPAWAPSLCKSLESCTSSNTNARGRSSQSTMLLWSHRDISEFSVWHLQHRPLCLKTFRKSSEHAVIWCISKSRSGQWKKLNFHTVAYVGMAGMARVMGATLTVGAKIAWQKLKSLFTDSWTYILRPIHS